MRGVDVPRVSGQIRKQARERQLLRECFVTNRDDEKRSESDRLLGARIHDFLKLRSMNQKELADKLLTSEAQVSRWISGERRPLKSRLRQIANILDIPIQALTAAPTPLLYPHWAHAKNPKPIRLGETLIDEVYLALGNHTEPIEITPRYTHEFPKIPHDIRELRQELLEKARRNAEIHQRAFFSSPCVRLLCASEIRSHQGADGREVKGVVLELAALTWQEHIVLNDYLDETLFPGTSLKTIRARYGQPEQVYRNAPDFRWCDLSGIFTVLMIPITTDGFGLVQLRSEHGVAFAPNRFISGVSENMHRYLDESPLTDFSRRLNSPADTSKIDVDHFYRPVGVPSPLRTAIRGLSEEVSEELGHMLETTPDRFVFLNIIFGFDYFHPFIVGIIRLPLDRNKTEKLIQQSPGKDHTEAKSIHFFNLDSHNQETLDVIKQKNTWFLPGLSAFITSILFWERHGS